MIGCVLVRRDPTPFVVVSFNQSVKVCDYDLILMSYVSYSAQKRNH